MMTAIVVALVFAAFAAGWFFGRSGLGSTVSPASLADRERLFVERMRESVLVGVFTTEGDPGRTASPERYEIAGVEKVNDELWRFNATMNCCGITGAMPIAVPLRWAGDTPMIAMTDTTCRVWAPSPCGCSSTRTATPARGTTASAADRCTGASRGSPRPALGPEGPRRDSEAPYCVACFGGGACISTR